MAGETVNTIVVAGGGAGGSQGAGGGAGGMIVDASFGVTATAYSITVGAGGDGVANRAVTGDPGGNSVFGTNTAVGGGGGGAWDAAAGNGGSGGGASAGQHTGENGTGTASQGFAGGEDFNSPDRTGGGGGGASEVGANGADGVGGNGGDGVANSISGSSVTYAGGGGGNVESALGTVGSGGAGGGGDGGNVAGGGSAPTAGTDGLGGGGGGSSENARLSADGGNGIVIMAFATDGSDGPTTQSTGGSITTSGANTIHTFTSSGTFTVSFSQDVAVTPAALTLSTTAQTPTILEVIAPGVRPLSLNLNAITIKTTGIKRMQGTTQEGPGTIGTRIIAKRYPVVEGLTAGTTKQTGIPYLVPINNGR